MGSSIRLPGRACFHSALAVVSLTAALLLALAAVGATSADASPTAPTMGKAAPFAVLAHTTVTNTGPTVVSGDLGVYSGSAVTGFTTSTPPGAGKVTNGKQYKATTVAKTAQASLSVAYTRAAAAPLTQSLTGKNLASMRLTAGVYTSTSTIALTGTVTLTGTTSSVFIFQAASTLITGTGSAVVLAGGVQACNVFWQVGSSATLKTGTKFFGTVMASTSASLTKTVTVTGRVLAKTGAVTLLSDHVTVPTCSAPTVTPPPTVTTTAPSSTLVTLGASVHDVATVTGNTTDGTPTGSVQFYQCGPGSILCASTTGTALTLTEALSGGVATSPSFTPSAIGTFCFAAVYTPASGSPYAASSEAGSTSNGECVTVSAVPGRPPTVTPPPTVTTSAPSSTRVTLGASVHDVATVTGNTTDGTPSGSVQFYQCGPGSILCASTTGTALTPTEALSGGVATSPSFTPSAIGTFCFAAVYTPASGSPYTASSEAGSTPNGECVTVSAVPVAMVPTTTKTTTTAPPVTTTPSAAATTSAVVPATHTGEPWAGWLYWLMVAILAAAGFGLIAGRARRRPMRHQEDG